MAGPVGLIPSTEDYSLDIPDVPLDISDEKRRKSISKSKQWKEILTYLQQRREIFTKQLPGGPLFKHLPHEEVANQVIIANEIISEIDGLISYVEAVNGISGN